MASTLVRGIKQRETPVQMSTNMALEVLAAVGMYDMADWQELKEMAR